jgi:CO dehydrogenase maturation factor
LGGEPHLKKVMNLRILDDNPRPEKRKNKLEKIVEENLDKIVKILRDRDYEVLEPRQMTGKKAPKATVSKKGPTRVVGFAGKGGVGKTSVAALFLRAIQERGPAAILAVDSDPNACLPGMLGAREYVTLGDMIEGYKGGRLPIRKFRQDFNSLLLKNEQDGYDLLPMGRAEGQGCYCSVNNLLKTAFRDFVLGGNYAYDFAVMDCEAGIEHISRKTSAFINDLVIVTDGSRMSLNTIKNIRVVGRNVGIEIERYYVVANRVGDQEMLGRIKGLCRELGMDFLGEVPEDAMLRKLNFQGKPVYDLPKDSEAYRMVSEMVNTILA